MHLRLSMFIDMHVFNACRAMTKAPTKQLRLHMCILLTYDTPHTCNLTQSFKTVYFVVSAFLNQLLACFCHIKHKLRGVDTEDKTAQSSLNQSLLTPTLMLFCMHHDILLTVYHGIHTLISMQQFLEKLSSLYWFFSFVVRLTHALSFTKAHNATANDILLAK